MPTQTRRMSSAAKKGIVAGVGAVLVVAMIVSTKFLSPSEAAEINPAAFDASVYVDEKFPEIVTAIEEQATDIATLVPAITADPAAAGAEYGNNLGSGKFAFPVRATGTVTEVDDQFLVLAVEGVGDPDVIRVPLANAISGTPVRDATGLISFGDFVDQTQYQNVANAMKLKIQSEVMPTLDPTQVADRELTVYGAWATGGPPNSYIIQPVRIEVGA